MINYQDHYVIADIDRVKQIFLTIIHESYIELKFADDEPPATISIGDYCYGLFFKKDPMDIELRQEFKAEDYGNLFLGKARNFWTGEEGLTRVRNFFDETKECTNIQEFMKKVASFYSENTGDNFRKTLELAAAAIAEIDYREHVPENKKNLNYIIAELYPKTEFKEAQCAVGKAILKQAAKRIWSTDETLQQQLFRINPNIYPGDALLQEKVNIARIEADRIEADAQGYSYGGFLDPDEFIPEFADANQLAVDIDAR